MKVGDTIQENDFKDQKWANLIHAHLEGSALTKMQTAKTCANAIEDAARIIVNSFKRNGKLLICGNGGSAADALHMAAEFIHLLRSDSSRSPMPAIALVDNPSLITAISNDKDFASVFAIQVEALGRAGDTLICISTSGNAQNVLQALEMAHMKDIKTIAITGSRGEMIKRARVSIAIPSTDTQQIQEAHLSVEHILCELVEQMLFPGI